MLFETPAPLPERDVRGTPAGATLGAGIIATKSRSYPYTVEQSPDGAWQVRFPDAPEALTEGATEAEAHALAADALTAALEGQLDR